MVGVDPERAQADRAEFLVANRDRVRRSPVLVRLKARGEEVDVRLERRLKSLVPVLEVGKDRQRMRGESVEARAKNVGNFAFVDEHGHLRVANRQLAAVLNFAVLHGIAVGENSVSGFDPLNNIDELLGNEITKAHG